MLNKFGLASMLVVILCIAVVGCACAKGTVDLDRILREHKITIGTTEQAGDISRFILDSRINHQSTMAVSDLLLKTKSMKGGESTLYIVDRSKGKAEDYELLPCPLSAIDQNEVILYARKTPGAGNRWEMLVSAPNEKWLQWELERICTSDVRRRSLDDLGRIIDQYKIKRMLIVSTEGRQIANDWVMNQTQPGKDAIDWDYMDASAWNGNASTDVLFLLDKQKIPRDAVSLMSALPKTIQASHTSDTCESGISAAKETVQDSTGTTRSICAVISPCARHLCSAINRYNSLDSIPESLKSENLKDLRQYGRMAIMVRSGDRSIDGDDNVLNDFCAKLTTAMSGSVTGFECMSDLDLKEIKFNFNDDSIDPATLAEIKKKIGKANAFAVADLSALDVSTTYISNTPVCETSRYGEYSEPQPTEPRRPNPNEKPLFRGHTYDEVNGSRSNDPKYIRDLNNYRHKLLPAFERAMRTWERMKREHEEKCNAHEMDWVVSIDAIQSAQVSGNLRIYDTGNLSSEKAGKVIYSCSLSGEVQRQSLHKSDRRVVRGEDNKPDSLDVPESSRTVSDKTIVSDALKAACEKGVSNILMTAMVPSDALNGVVIAEAETEDKQILESASATQIVGVKLAKKPTAADLDQVRETALADACPKLLEDIKTIYPDASISLEDIQANATIVSEGWNAKTGEYRVKYRFEGQVVIASSENEGAK